MRTRYAVCVVLFVVGLLCAGAARAAPIAALVEQVGPSVVYIEGEGGCGSGFVVRTDPHVEILTNYHVMEGGTKYTIYFFVKSDKTGEIETKAVPGYAYFAFPRLDFGVIRLEADDPDVKRLLPRIKALPHGDSEKVRVGERVFLAATKSRGDDLLGLCVSLKDGQVLWSKPLGRGRTSRSAEIAACSPASDGRCVYFLFGTGELAATDLEGNVRWSRDLAKDYGCFAIRFGESGVPF